MEKKKIYPNFTTTPSGVFNAIDIIEHPFLQAVVDAKAQLIFMQGEFTVFACESLVLLFVYEDAVEIECIATPPELRGNGSASRVMQALCDIADHTKTVLTLRTANVTGNGWNMPQHIVIATGMVKTGKIPVAKLPDWYSKFGFEKTEKVMVPRRKRPAGWRMKRIPNLGSH